MTASASITKTNDYSLKIIYYLSICFLLSGMCGLIYQVVWSRMLCLIFGHTTFAISTVLTVFMGGLALGSYLFGQWADKEGKIKNLLSKAGRSPVFLMYGLLEFLTGIYCLFTPLLFNIIEEIYLKFPDLPFYVTNIFRFCLCILVLIIPTFLMGGTLPVISKFLIRTSHELSKKLGFLYFINTIGAVTGTILSGFFLIDTFGLTLSLQVAALINIGIGLLIYVVNKNPENILTCEEEKVLNQNNNNREDITERNENTLLIFIIFAFTGFSSMVYELTWTRALSLILASTTYAFSTMLATFLFGIALGSIIYSKLCKKFTFTQKSFGWIEILIGIICLIIIPVIGKLPLIIIEIFPYVKTAYKFVLFTNFIICFLIILSPTILMGFVFPLVGKLYTRNIAQIGKSIGNIYAVNTIGCILGSFITGFFLIPFAGIQNSLKLAVTINILSGFILLYGYLKKLSHRIIIIASTGLILTVLFLIPRWNPSVMTCGPFIYGDVYSEEYKELKSSGDEFFKNFRLKYLVFQKDGISCTVSVYKFNDKVVFLKVNGKTDASTTDDMATQLMAGCLPLIYHKNPEDVFIIGLGSGITGKAVLDFPEVSSVTCAEIEPAVIEAEHFFSAFNGNVMKNPVFKIKVADARNEILASAQKYDVIISEPSNPWIAGIASLFTVDFYEICKNKMKPGGIYCQWLQLYRMAPEDVDMVMRTFYTSFPEGLIWMGSTGDLLLLGSSQKLLFDYEKLENLYYNNKKFRSTLTDIGIKTPDEFFVHYITGSEYIEDIKAGPVNTDDLPVLEFSAPKSLFLKNTIEINLSKIWESKRELLPPLEKEKDNNILSINYYITTYKLYYKLAPGISEKILQEALKIYPEKLIREKLSE